MTEEIIINGVDVSECLHLDDWKHCNCCNDLVKTIYPKATKCLIEEDLRCETYPNCYFKQLKRQEQKNENLNEVTIQQRKENTELTIKLGEMINRGGELCGELQKYKQALDKISKEIDTIIRVDGNSFDDALTKEFALIQDIINKAKEK